jgi:alkylation response protein AidB-like acyl-CoA dehydrogenase
MNLIYSEEEQRFRIAVREWLTANLPEGWGTDHFETPAEYRDDDEFLRDWQRRLYEGGWAAVAWPSEYGGRGASLMEQVIFEEERELARAPFEYNVFATRMAGPMLIASGTEEQRQRYLPPMLAGKEAWAEGFSEPSAGSDLAALRTTAVLQDDEFVINGRKIWTSRAGHADRILLLARTDQAAPKHKGISAFIVDAKSPGIRMEPIRQMTGESEFYEVAYDDVRVPAANLIGELNQGWQIAIRTLAFERMAVAYIFELITRMSELTDDLRLRGEHDPVVLDELAQLFTEIHGARLLYYRGVTVQSETGIPGPEGTMAKLLTSELAKRLTAFALEVAGQEGMEARPVRAWGGVRSPWAFEFLAAFRQTIAGGTSEIMRNIIGERALGLPR